MSNRNVVFMVTMPYKADVAAYAEHSIATWERWCERNGVRLVVWKEPLTDMALMKPTWQRYHLLDILDRSGIEWDRVAYADSDTMVRWDCPNFFDMVGDELAVVRDNSPRWSYLSMKAHRRFFPDVELPWYDYFNAGFMVFGPRHRSFCRAILDFYAANREALLELEARGCFGTDQTPVNYLARREGVLLRFLPPVFNLLPLNNLVKGHLYVEMGYVWHFAGIPDDLRAQCMGHAWQALAHNYLSEQQARDDGRPPSSVIRSQTTSQGGAEDNVD